MRSVADISQPWLTQLTSEENRVVQFKFDVSILFVYFLEDRVKVCVIRGAEKFILILLHR